MGAAVGTLAARCQKEMRTTPIEKRSPSPMSRSPLSIVRKGSFALTMPHTLLSLCVAFALACGDDGGVMPFGDGGMVDLMDGAMADVGALDDADVGDSAAPDARELTDAARPTDAASTDAGTPDGASDVLSKGSAPSCAGCVQRSWWERWID